MIILNYEVQSHTYFLECTQLNVEIIHDSDSEPRVQKQIVTCTHSYPVPSVCLMLTGSKLIVRCRTSVTSPGLDCDMFMHVCVCAHA